MRSIFDINRLIIIDYVRFLSSIENIDKQEPVTSWFLKWLFGPEKFTGLSRNGPDDLGSPTKKNQEGDIDSWLA